MTTTPAPTATTPTLPADVPPFVIPLWAPPAWRAAVAAADYRCQCPGTCGAKHNTTRGGPPRRCIRSLRGPAAVALFAVPSEPGASVLIVLCRRCADGRDAIARRTARQATDQHAGDAPTLF